MMTTDDKKKPRILVASGEPAGIGPEIVLKLIQYKPQSNITIVGDPDLLQKRAGPLSISMDGINIIPVSLQNDVVAGKADPANASYVLEMLDIACNACLENKFDALVTAPVQKSIINDAGIPFTGHTEYLAKKCNDAYPVMVLAGPDFRVALVTTHVPLREVANTISKKNVERVLQIIISEMQERFDISKPTISVCGLNPHAGEGGYLGFEEQESIIPVINQFRSKGENIIGPLPADTAFLPEQRKITDVFLCMYHDQGLPVLKALGFGRVVNITLGLPIIRTSVDHGTALELAGTGKAKCDSLLAAIETAEEMVVHQNKKKRF